MNLAFQNSWLFGSFFGGVGNQVPRAILKKIRREVADFEANFVRRRIFWKILAEGVRFELTEPLRVR